jgi:hypothetical protein
MKQKLYYPEPVDIFNIFQQRISHILNGSGSLLIDTRENEEFSFIMAAMFLLNFYNTIRKAKFCLETQ